MNQFKAFLEHGVPHAMTTRLGGVSTGYFGEMNTGFFGEDRYETVLENMRRVVDALGHPIAAIFATVQVHGTRIACVDDKALWETYKQFPTQGTALDGIALYAIPACDGMVTTRDDVLLMTFYADCVPLIAYDVKTGAVGNMHAGWRGTANKAAVKLVERLTELYGTAPKDLQVAIGQSAGPCCYEVDQKVYEAFSVHYAQTALDAVFKAGAPGHYDLDLKWAHRLCFLEAGVPEKAIDVEPDCTICTQSDGVYRYHSHRRSGGKRGSMSAFIGTAIHR